MQKKILVVDDDEALSGVLADFVKLEGYEVETADSSSDALHLLSHSRLHMGISERRLVRTW